MKSLDLDNILRITSRSDDVLPPLSRWLSMSSGISKRALPSWVERPFCVSVSSRAFHVPFWPRRLRAGYSKEKLKRKMKERTDRRSILLPTLLLNYHLRHPGHLSFAGLQAPLVLRGRDARSQLRQSGRSAVREVSSRKNVDRKGWQGAGPERSRKDK